MRFELNGCEVGTDMGHWVKLWGYVVTSPHPISDSAALAAKRTVAPPHCVLLTGPETVMYVSIDQTEVET